MSWQASLLTTLSAAPVCGYQLGQAGATEPTALTALALLAHGRRSAALPATDWLAGQQDQAGRVGTLGLEGGPGWPTSLALWAWLAATDAPPGYRGVVLRAIAWILAERGESWPRSPILGHDTTLVGWSWAEGTHSWVEPTALHVVALQAAGQGHHPRVREAVRLLLDRQLPAGGWNYGNTMVMGNMLRPHVQPTGVALLALAGESAARGRIENALRYLEQNVNATTTTTSLGWALLGLAAHGRSPPAAATWLERAFRRTMERDRSPYKCALLALAAQGAPLVALASASST